MKKATIFGSLCFLNRNYLLSKKANFYSINNPPSTRELSVSKTPDTLGISM